MEREDLGDRRLDDASELEDARVRGRGDQALIVSEAVLAQTPGVGDAIIGEAGVRASFARQGFMAHLGAELGEVGAGTCTISCRPRPELTQQHGFMHAGVVAAIADSAAGYAALSLMPAGSEVLTVEFKLNLLSPAEGDLLVARGRVLRPGRTLTVCEAAVAALRHGAEIPCAVMLATMIRRA
jgi:uncharacterized protein (TIGR00369 family)